MENCHQVFATLGNLSVTEVRLEAEEDMCKYNRLVKYYEDLGFRQLEGSKVHYVHHCDQIYRKVRIGGFGSDLYAVVVSSVLSSDFAREQVAVIATTTSSSERM